ncbi:diguanylate cyclase [Streptomyces inusitatus]|uniref:Diguanylate cyclase n=1 Tax=Streptomyces inusitatus TaxID=68221 RepID=A0A918QHD4_9ACTN|nr:PAS domain-containing protein [Streptomyces inusitatus]GGZ45595.1 diguanylate cyclase [Streptomyces inusitatus]
MSASKSEPTLTATAGAGAELLAALLDGMDAALCAFGADGTITHWNREAERVLGWSAQEAVGRRGFTGWAVRSGDAADVEARLTAAMDAPGRTVNEFALLRKDGGRVLVRTQSAPVLGATGERAGLYCAFNEVHTQIGLERSIALSEALFDDTSWGLVLVDVDLRPTVVNVYAAEALGTGRPVQLGRPLGELVVQGVEELEAALQHVLAEGEPRGVGEMWVTLAGGPEPGRRRCWRSGFLRLASPLAEEPVPLGVGWVFQDVTAAKLAEQEADRLRFRASQLHRAARAAGECEDPLEATTAYLDFALAGFADHVLVDVVEPGDRGRLVRAAATPASGAPGPCLPVAGGGIPVRYPSGHPALQAAERIGSVRASAPAAAVSAPATVTGTGTGTAGAASASWCKERQWPAGMSHALCTVLRSRGRTLGVVTFLRGSTRPVFERADAVYAESMSAMAALALDLAGRTPS